MRGFITLVFIAAIGWSLYWFVGSNAQKSTLNGWLADRRAAGWQAQTKSLKVTGFPNRFDTIITGMVIADPSQGWSWTAPDFRILALSYKPNHIIVALPGKHSFTSRNEDFSTQSELARASLVFTPNTSLSLDRLQLETKSTQMISANGETANIGATNIALFAATEKGAATYDLFAGIKDLTPSKNWRDMVDPAAVLPESISGTMLDATLVFDRPWDRHTVESVNPTLTAIELHSTQFIWGTLGIKGDGSVTIRPDGVIDGTLNLQIRNWSALLEVARKSGYFPEMLMANIERGLSLIAQLSTSQDSIKVALRFADGKTYIGPLAIADAPRLNR